MEKVLKAEWIPKKENREKVYENVIFETPVRGLDISYKTGSGSFEVDVCINGKIIAVAALTSTAGYRDLETVHVDIPEIVPGTYTISFRTEASPYFHEFIFTETSYTENAGTYEIPEYHFKETDIRSFSYTIIW